MNSKKTISDIYNAIFNIMCVSEEMLKSSSKKTKNCDARKIFSYLCVEQGISLNTIGEYLNRDRSSIDYLVKDFPEKIKYDKVLREIFFKVKMYLERKK